MTKTISVSREDGVALLTLANGVTNALSPQLITELQETVKGLKKEACGLIISGGEKFFSMGLDLPSLLELSEEEMSSFWRSFDQVLLDIYTYPFPTLCAVQGHAIAGGTILALSCDYRIASGTKKMGLNEIHLGIPVPFLAALMLKQVVGERVAKQMMYSGEFIGFDKACSIGLVDQLVEPDELMECARAKVADLMKAPSRTFSTIKAGFTAANADLFTRERETQHKQFLDFWFDDQVQEKLKEAASKF